jgi:2-polyprenyl-3-methyl-5-hydroxy-6-metoxy-1,4-benzoquinol methylase
VNERKLRRVLLEIKYGQKLRKCTKNERNRLVEEAYNAVRALGTDERSKNTPEGRTAGTSQRLIKALTMLCTHNDRVLEIGCGRGYSCLMIAPYIKSIVGIDASKPNIEEAKEILLKNNIRNFQLYHLLTDLLLENFDPQSFDKIISIDVLEHLHPEDYLTHLSDAFKMLKPRGYYIAVGPNRLTGPHDVTRIVYPYATEPMGFHLNEFSYKDIVSDMRDVGFRNIRSPLPVWPLFPIICGKILVSSKWFVYAENIFFPVNSFRLFNFLDLLFGRVFVIAKKPSEKISGQNI